jgi:hypothetical protein
VSFLAVVHLLAVAIIVAWLWKSHRLDAARFTDIRTLISTPVHEAREGMIVNLREAENQRLKEAEDVLKANPPRDSATQIQRTALVMLQEDQARRRLDDEKRMMQEQLALRTASVDDLRAEFDRERQAWENAVRSDRTQKTDEQFMQAVKQYEQSPPKQAKRMLQELVTQGQLDQAVAYLDAMNPRAASKVLKEFKTDEEIKLAAELLENLRTLGSAPTAKPSLKDSSDAPGTANSDQSAADPASPA